MQNNLVETLIGAIVLAVAGFFFFFAYGIVGAGGGTGGTKVFAKFDRVDGISVGSDVRMSGIKIGTVSNLELDPKNFMAKAELSISKSVQLPDDSSVKITSEGLLGGSYLAVEAGGSDKILSDGGEITNTQGSIDMIGLISRAVFSAGDSDATKKPAEQQPDQP